MENEWKDVVPVRNLADGIKGGVDACGVWRCTLEKLNMNWSVCGSLERGSWPGREGVAVGLRSRLMREM